MQNYKAVEHRLGIARRALKDIIAYNGEQGRWMDDWEYINRLTHIAKEALKDMDSQVDKRRKRLENDQRIHIERVAREVKKEVPA